MSYFFQNLLTASFHGSVIIAAVLLLRVVLQKAPKRAVCLLWMIAFIRLLMPFQLESRLSLQPEAIPLEEAPFYEAVFPEDPKTQDNQNITIDTQPIVPAIPEDAGGESIGGGEVVYESVPALEEPTVIHWTQLLPYVWALGAMLMLLYAFGSYVHLKLTVREAVKVIGGWECDRIETAFILGYFRPRVYVPMGLTRRTRKHILSHEWAHLRSGDHWFKLLAYLALSLHWFNPLAWAAYRLMCKDMEHACDERVIRYMDLTERKQYSHALLTCSTNRSHYTPCPVAFGEVSVKSRILSVLNYRKPGFWITLAAVVAVAFVGVFLMTSPETAEVPNTDIGNTDELLHDVEIDEVVRYTAPAYPDATEVYTVASIDDFLAALGSDRIIELPPGDFKLWEADTYNTDEDTGKFYYWNTEFGRNELIIQNVDNLIIRGSGRDDTEFISENLDSDVLRFENCSRIALEGFKAGHKQLPDSCGGGVIGLTDCADVNMDDLGLYGCGAVGIIAKTCERMVVTNTDIYDCSAYGVHLWDTDSVRFENCRFYRIGDRAPDSHGRAVLHIDACDAVEFYACSITDSYAYTLMTEYNCKGVELSQVHFENNTALNFALDLHSRMDPVVMEKCTFKDNTIIRWYSAEAFSAVNRSGDTLTSEKLDSGNTFSAPPAQTEVYVSNVDELLAAIAPDTCIVLEAKEYKLSDAKNYGTGSSDYYTWYDLVDGPELIISDVSNLTIKGAGQDKTTISAVPRYANVLSFKACSNITISDLTAGHTREEGVCSGGVLFFASGSHITVNDCGLYGCGVYGVTTSYIEQIAVEGCEIYECSLGGVYMSNTNGIILRDNVFRDLGGVSLNFISCAGIVTEGNTLPELTKETSAPSDGDIITSAELRYAGQPLAEFTDAVGSDTELTLYYEPKDLSLTNTDVKWVSADSTVASVRGNHRGCIITCESEGETTIVCQIFDKDVCSVRVHVRDSW